MDGSSSAARPDRPNTPLTEPPAAPPPQRPHGKRPLGAVLAAGVMIGLGIGVLGLLVRGVSRREFPRRGPGAGAESRIELHEDAAPTGGGSDEDGDLVPDVDPALFRNRLEAVSGGTKPVWEEGAPATLVDFWASWCLPCLAELPHLQELQHRVEGRGMRVVLVNVDLNEAASAGRFLQKKGIHLDSLVDREAVLFQAAGLGALPSAFVLDAKGRPVMFFEGGMGREELETALLRANEKNVRATFR